MAPKQLRREFEYVRRAFFPRWDSEGKWRVRLVTDLVPGSGAGVLEGGRGGVMEKRKEAKQVETKEWPFREAPGYVLRFDRLENYKDYGLGCWWQHCIELMPLPGACSVEDVEINERYYVPGKCLMFGHMCPGGVAQAAACWKEWHDAMMEREFCNLDWWMPEAVSERLEHESQDREGKGYMPPSS